MRQVEVSPTIVFDAPRHARGFFEALCTDNVDIGRPQEMQVIFGRRVRTPPVGGYRSRLLCSGDEVTLNAYFRHSRDRVGCAARCLRAGPFPRSLPPNPVGIFRCARLSSDLRREFRSALPVMNEVVAGRADHEGLASLSGHEFHPFGAGWS